MDLLLIIRGLAALAVVVWHAVGHEGGYPLINLPGRTAVWLFFGISGYVIAHGFIHRRYTFSASDLRDFYSNRLLRIYPLFLALTLIGWVTALVSTGSSPLTLGDVPAQIFALQFNQDYILNGVFWTLGVELHFYLLAPLLVAPFFIRDDRRRWWVASSLYVAMIGWGYFARIVLGWSSDGRNILMNLPHFFIGMIACSIAAGMRPDARRFSVCIGIACALLAYTSWMYHRMPSRFWSPQGTLLVDLSIFLLVLAHASLEPARFRKGPFYAAFAFLGVLSYGIYAWHGYFMKAIPQIADHVFVLIAVSIFAAYVTYRLIELPALRLKRKHAPKARVPLPSGGLQPATPESPRRHIHD